MTLSRGIKPLWTGDDAIQTKVKQELDGTPYACSSLRPLAGGSTNFIYHGILVRPLSDDTREVVVKHGEGYVGSFPDFKLPTSRCVCGITAVTIGLY